jgi:drug/metabolite transporter (DMT)-like permease
VGVFLGLCIAAAFGSGDFLGGRSARLAPTISVVLVVQVVALAGAIGVVVAVSGSADGHDLLLGAAAGAANVVGLGLLYRALATGRMGTVAPITAVVGAVVPVAWGLTRGERPGGVALVGVVLAVAGAALLARESDVPGSTAGRRASVWMAVAAGAGLGLSFVLFAKTSHASGFWPVLSARAASLTLAGAAFLAIAPRRGSSTGLRGAAAWAAAGAGLCDVTANVVLLVAVRRALTVIVAPVAALAPAFTVFWASVILGERLVVSQWLALVLGLLGLVLIAIR